MAEVDTEAEPELARVQNKHLFDPWAECFAMTSTQTRGNNGS
jgi:hypothetical protein